MQKLNIDLEYCYGIRKLKKTLDFSHTNAVAIYAPNGAMKTSLAATFLDISEGNQSGDRIFPKRPTKRLINDENDVDIEKEYVLVVKPYDETEYRSSQKVSTLLVNTKLRKEYEELRAEIDKAKETFLKAVQGQAKSKRDFEKEISLAFTGTDDKFEVALNRIKDEVKPDSDSPLKDVPYDLVFDEKVQSFLNAKDVKSAIQAYIETYNALLEASTYFKKGVFNYYNAGQIAKQLTNNGFFKAKHFLTLNAHEKKEITTEKELEELITSEKEWVLPRFHGRFESV